MADHTAMPRQTALDEECRRNSYRQPVYQIMSDRRGGRTAWSATVEVNGNTVPAKYWYDGQYVHNAKEDAADQALLWLKMSPEQQRAVLEGRRAAEKEANDRMWREHDRKFEEMRREREESSREMDRKFGVDRS